MKKVSDSENSEHVSFDKGVDCVIVEDEELSEHLCVPKNENIPRENCILVEPDISIKISEEAKMYEKEAKDPFFKRKFVKKPEKSGPSGYDQLDVSKNLKSDGASTSKVPYVGRMVFLKPISQHSVKEKVYPKQAWKPKGYGSKANVS
ncbi:hypothetical protein L1987_46622 [Smallanthus sonchifolius]|uniref:Uncharacterized protein n=1 Tax=Smallanthus sonchifolius TaxID=185202 RepID=A0ACB9G205_9ASTR|nr:hypothetical protein L1987_46622 [Smallanthus sonchifolius]